MRRCTHHSSGRKHFKGGAARERRRALRGESAGWSGEHSTLMAGAASHRAWCCAREHMPLSTSNPQHGRPALERSKSAREARVVSRRVGTHLAGLALGVILLLLFSGSFGIRLGLVLLLDLLLLRIGQLIRNLLDVLGRHCRNEGKLREGGGDCRSCLLPRLGCARLCAPHSVEGGHGGMPLGLTASRWDAAGFDDVMRGHGGMPLGLTASRWDAAGLDDVMGGHGGMPLGLTASRWDAAGLDDVMRGHGGVPLGLTM